MENESFMTRPATDAGDNQQNIRKQDCLEDVNGFVAVNRSD